MAEKGETKILTIITICIMLVSIGFCGCIEDNNGKEKKSYMVIMIHNGIGKEINVWVNVSQNNNYIFSKYISFDSSYISLRNITEIKGTYTVSIEMNNNLSATDSSIKVGDPTLSTVHVSISNDEIEIDQKHKD